MLYNNATRCDIEVFSRNVTNYDFKRGQDMKPTIGLRMLRKARGWTQLQAAEELGFCRSYMSAVENGKQGVSVEMINAIIRVFGVKYEDFYKS
jgi:DNA-binding XRE family transcriptional regulator